MRLNGYILFVVGVAGGLIVALLPDPANVAGWALSAFAFHELGLRQGRHEAEKRARQATIVAVLVQKQENEAA